MKLPRKLIEDLNAAASEIGASCYKDMCIHRCLIVVSSSPLSSSSSPFSSHIPSYHATCSKWAWRFVICMVMKSASVSSLTVIS